MPRLPWEDEALSALERVPRLVRGLVRRKVEERVRGNKGRIVRLADFKEAEARFQALRGGRSEKELAAVMPAGNRPGVEMVVLESCRHELADCPNALIDTAPWREALEDWLSRDQVSERLRRRIADDQVLYHHKLRLAVAGCPNGCSRPQIADLALVGFVRPSFDLDACSACGTCAEACPDRAIVVEDELKWAKDLCQGCLACGRVCPDGAVSLTRPGARMLMGGKLGRHPRLARIIDEVHEPSEAVRYFAGAVDEYIDNAAPGERFAAWRSSIEKGTT